MLLKMCGISKQYPIACRLVWVWSWSFTARSDCEHGAEKVSVPKRKQVMEEGENYTTMIFIFCALHQILIN